MQKKELPLNLTIQKTEISEQKTQTTPRHLTLE